MQSREIILNNLIVLSNLDKFEKIVVDKSNNFITIDDRLGQSVRRWYTNDSKYDLYTATQFTFQGATNLYKKNKLDYDSIKKPLNNLSDKSRYTYQNFDDLHTLIRELESQLTIENYKKNSNIRAFSKRYKSTSKRKNVKINKIVSDNQEQINTDTNTDNDNDVITNDNSNDDYSSSLNLLRCRRQRSKGGRYPPDDDYNYNDTLRESFYYSETESDDDEVHNQGNGFGSFMNFIFQRKTCETMEVCFDGFYQWNVRILLAIKDEWIESCNLFKDFVCCYSTIHTSYCDEIDEIDEIDDNV